MDAPAAPEAPEAEARTIALPERELPNFGPDAELMGLIGHRGPSVPERLILPDELDRVSLPPPILQVNAFMPSLPGYGRGGGGEILMDYAVGRQDSLGLGYRAALFAQGESFPEGEPEFGWHRATFTYSRRLIGYARHADLDLSVDLGLSVDWFEVTEGPLRLESDGRVSPYAGITLGLWYPGNWGVIFRAGQTFPTDLTGYSTSATDVSAFLRIEVSPGFSLQLGYRALLFELKERDRREFESRMAGPLLGLEFPF